MTERLQRTSCRLDRPRNKLFSRAAGTIGLRSLVLPHLGNISGHKLGIFRDFYFIGLLFCLQQSNCIVCIFWDNSSMSFICFTEKIIIKNNFSTFPLIYVTGVFLSLNFFFVKFWPTSWSHAFFFLRCLWIEIQFLKYLFCFWKEKKPLSFFLASNSFYVCVQIGFIFYIYTLTKPQHCHHQASHNIYCECLYWRLCHERVRSRVDTVTVLWLLGHCRMQLSKFHEICPRAQLYFALLYGSFHL